MMPSVTVVTAAYNAAPFIAETIESVLAQTFTNFEYIVVDDGSSDATPDIVAQYTPQVTIIRQLNSGEGAARNRGFEIAGGDYVAVVDADDVWAPAKLERQVEAMDREPGAGLCYTNSAMIDAHGAMLQAAMVSPHPALTCRMALRGQYPIVNSSVLFRRAFLEARPYSNLRVGADFHLSMKVLWRADESSVFIDEPLVHYRVVETSVLRQVSPCERGRLNLQAFEELIADMRSEKPLPARLEREAMAFAHFQWAWGCVRGGSAYGLATRQLMQALRMDYLLAPRVAREFAKMGLRGMGWK